MATQTSLVARNVRLHEWALQIQDCRSRPSDMSVNEWCEKNHITKANYYYRMRRVRESLIKANQVPDRFVELPISATPDHSEIPALGSATTNDVAATVMIRNDIKIEIRNHASSSFLLELLKAVSAC